MNDNDSSNSNDIKRIGEKIRRALSIHLTSKPPGKQKERRSLSLRGSCFSGGYANKTWEKN